MPTAPAAPVLLTTPTGFFSTFSSAAATGRAVRSATPPGGNGATSVIGRDGYGSCARAPPESTTSAASTTTPNQPALLIDVPLASRPARAWRASRDSG